MQNVIEFSELQLWSDEAESRGLKIVQRNGNGEDPYTHYYAESPSHQKIRPRVGYFGFSNGADNNFGILFLTESAYNIWMDE